MVTSVGGADEGKAGDFPTKGGDESGRRGDRGRSAKGARPELAGSDRVGDERVEEEQRGGKRGRSITCGGGGGGAWWRWRNPNRSCRRRAKGDD